MASRNPEYELLRAAINATLRERKRYGTYNLPGLRKALRDAAAIRRRRTLSIRRFFKK